MCVGMGTRPRHSHTAYGLLYLLVYSQIILAGKSYYARATLSQCFPWPLNEGIFWRWTDDICWVSLHSLFESLLQPGCYYIKLTCSSSLWGRVDCISRKWLPRGAAPLQWTFRGCLSAFLSPLLFLQLSKYRLWTLPYLQQWWNSEIICPPSQGSYLPTRQQYLYPYLHRPRVSTLGHHNRVNFPWNIYYFKIL